MYGRLGAFVDICPRIDVLEMTVMLSYFLNRWFQFQPSCVSEVHVKHVTSCANEASSHPIIQDLSKQCLLFKTSASCMLVGRRARGVTAGMGNLCCTSHFCCPTSLPLSPPIIPNLHLHLRCGSSLKVAPSKIPDFLQVISASHRCARPRSTCCVWL